MKDKDKVNKETISKLEKDKEIYKQKAEAYEKEEKIKRQKIEYIIKFFKKLSPGARRARTGSTR